MHKQILYVYFIIAPFIISAQTDVYKVKNANVNFHSIAPNELIYAYSTNLKGILDTKKNTFLFTIDIASFAGFNNPLQKEHFNENYMETSFFPQSTYSGKIIEDVDLGKEGEYDVRTKGKLQIHGVEQELIIKAHVTSKNGTITIKSNFSILLADFNIKIPRIVSDKLSPEIKVSVNCTLLNK